MDAWNVSRSVMVAVACVLAGCSGPPVPELYPPEDALEVSASEWPAEAGGWPLTIYRGWLACEQPEPPYLLRESDETQYLWFYDGLGARWALTGTQHQALRRGLPGFEVDNRENGILARDMDGRQAHSPQALVNCGFALCAHGHGPPHMRADNRDFWRDLCPLQLD